MIFPAFPTLKNLPEPPYFAAIFISERSDNLDGYDEMDQATLEAVQDIPGYLGFVSLKEGNKGVFISYWNSPAAIELWRKNAMHRSAKEMGKKQWYSRYISQLCEIVQHGTKL